MEVKVVFPAGCLGRRLIAGAMLFGLVGCGGGGGGGYSTVSPPIATYTVSGAVTGLAAGESLTLENNGADNQHGQDCFAVRDPVRRQAFAARHTRGGHRQFAEIDNHRSESPLRVRHELR